MRKVDISSFSSMMGIPASADLGMKPGLAWIPIENLRIDPGYQREVLRNGSRNIVKIAMNFDWSLFGIVVVANIGDNLFAIVDGQHRTIAAALRNIEEVSCVVIDADPKKQAKAFSAINGATTAISKLAIFHAQVFQGDPAAQALFKVCKDAGVEICRYPIPAGNMKRGQTLAIGALQDAMRNYGQDTLAFALRFILASKGDYQGILKSSLVRAACHVLDAEKDWAKYKARLLAIVSDIDLIEMLSEAEIDAKRMRRPTRVALSLKLFAAIDEVF